MTFKESMMAAMTSRGMFDNQALEVITSYIEENKDDSMVGRWDNNTSDYPENLQIVLWLGVKKHALTWIERTIPEAWFKPMFQDTDELGGTLFV